MASTRDRIEKLDQVIDGIVEHIGDVLKRRKEGDLMADAVVGPPTLTAFVGLAEHLQRRVMAEDAIAKDWPADKLAALAAGYKQAKLT